MYYYLIYVIHIKCDTLLQNMAKVEVHFCTLEHILKEKRMRILSMFHLSKYLRYGQRCIGYKIKLMNFMKINP